MDGRVTAEEASGNHIYYRYDEAGELVSLNYDGEEYFYVKNIQGDIIGLVDETGSLVVEYEYDAWGVMLSCTGSMAGTLGEANPFRYRSYYYDIETGLYYCQSRYYNPEWGRWTNADDPALLELNSGELIGANLFAYCHNNPVMNTDPSGYFVVRRWMISVPIDIILRLIPAIGTAFAPIKALVKKYTKSALKNQVSGVLAKFIKVVAGTAKTLIKGLQSVLKKVPLVGGWLSSKIPVNKWTTVITGATSSAIINKLLNTIISNIDIVLSVGGLLSGILDYIFDKKLNNSIWVF